jgi:hypothetical protein
MSCFSFFVIRRRERCYRTPPAIQATLAIEVRTREIALLNEIVEPDEESDHSVDF